jgi:mannan endo-1,4-beta-mannosidase
VRDREGRVSNEATLTVTVKPSPTGILRLFSFETGVEGWHPAGGTGTLAQSSAWASDGTSSLEVGVTAEGWFASPELVPPAELTGKTELKVDLQTLGAQTYRNVAIQTGDGWAWCQATGGNTPQGSVDTVVLDLTTCAGADLTKLKAVNVYLQGGTFRIDNVRAE